MGHNIQQFFANRRLALPLAIIVFLFCFSLGEAFVFLQHRDARTRRLNQSLALTADLRSRVEHELNSLLFLSSGLGGYLKVRHDSLYDPEVEEILAVLHQSNNHIRSFGIAIGYQITHVYPLEGNLQAIGLDYRQNPEQWPLIEFIANSGKPALDGPIDLVQGGKGLIYRVPLLIDGNYWGLLSTVIDMDQLITTIFNVANKEAYDLSLYSVVASIERPIIGDPRLSLQANSVTQTISVPGGHWLLTLLLHEPQSILTVNNLFRIANVFVCVLIAWLMYALINNRAGLAELARYDSLTGLPNRRMLEDRHQQLLARINRQQNMTGALLFLDLNGFKAINDTHGHKAGDIVLREVSQRLRRLVRPNDTVARWGGDEFILLLENLDPDQLKKLIARLRDTITQPIQFSDHLLQISTSIGSAFYPAEEISLEKIIREADQQMYNDKARIKQKS